MASKTFSSQLRLHQLAFKEDVVIGLPKLKYVKDQLCSSCEMKEKGDPCILVGYSTQSKGYRNKRTRLIVESIHLRFDEIKEMFETSVCYDTSGLFPNDKSELDLLFGPLYDEFFNDGTSRVNKSSSPTDNSAPQDTHPSTNIHPTSEPSTPTNVHAEENNDNQAEFTNPFCTPVQENAESSSRNIGNSNVHNFNQPQDSEYRWTKDHPLTQVRGNPSKPVQTRRQLATDPEMSMQENIISLKRFDNSGNTLTNLVARTSIEGEVYVTQQTDSLILNHPTKYIPVYGKHYMDSKTSSESLLFQWPIMLVCVDTRKTTSGGNTVPSSQAVNKSPTHYPCDSARTFRVILFSIHNDEWKSFQCHHQTALRSYALSWKPCQGDSLNLPDHRIHKDGDGDASFQLKSDSLPHAHAHSTKTFYKHQDSRIMKAQELKTKTSANSDINDNSSEIKLRGRLLESFQDDAKYEHVGQDTRSQGGKDLYCKGKDHEEYILKSIDEGPFKMGRCRNEIATGTDGPYLGPERDRAVADLSQAEKDRLRADIRATNILLQGSELTKDDHESQLYDEFEHFGKHKGENIHDYYQHELHANENKTLMERLNQHSHDTLALMSNVSPYQYPSSSSIPLQPSYIPPVTYQPQFTDNTQLDTGFSPADELLNNLTKQVAFLAQQYKTQFPQTNNQLRTSSNTQNQVVVQNGRVVVQNVQGRRNRVQGNNARGAAAAGNGGAQYRAGNANAGQGKPIKCYNCNGIGNIARNCIQPKRPQNSDYFKEKMLLMQAQENGVDLDEEQLLFLAGGQSNTFDDEVDERPVQDMAHVIPHQGETTRCNIFINITQDDR
ncbi:retrovirus-related pol polyprotein from transposon TNT 1-94 [Tanacetum coccineum]|uniref:Retrovirus-related pol polyprotein from transposon TNT 1-94 n=1 Tax=Tanacetum coccineum TaxID=301880 RepID=A0ABQ5DCL4_9ASTR